MQCQHCGSPVQPGQAFCTNCGQAVESVAAEKPVVEKPVKKVKTAKPKRGPGCLKWLLIVLVLGAVGVILLCGVYWFVAKPRLEAYILDQIQAELEGEFEITAYEGPTHWVEIAEDDINSNIALPAPLRRFVQSAGVSFEQDRVRLTFTLLNIDGEISADASATATGDLLIHDADTRGIAWLIFFPQTLESTATSYVNQNFVHPAHLRLLAVQITDNRLWFAFESR